jgi:truncated hemoglobin YjbI
MKNIFYKFILVFFLFAGIFSCTSNKTSISKEEAEQERKINEYWAAREKEQEKAEKEREAERKKIEKEEIARKEAELEVKYQRAREAIQKAISSKNADIIMQSLNEIQSSLTTNTNRELLRGEAIINDAYLAIARIATRNNNIQLEWLGNALDNAGDRRLSSSEVIRVFNQNKVYYQDQLIIEQRIGDDYVIYTGYNDARRFIVLKNVKNVVNWDRKYWVLDVFMKYTGVSTLKLISGNIDVPTFDVIYQYKD